jgi:hypothetical protein
MSCAELRLFRRTSPLPTQNVAVPPADFGQRQILFDEAMRGYACAGATKRSLRPGLFQHSFSPELPNIDEETA